MFYGSWELLSKQTSKTGYWLCKCTNCGITKLVFCGNLTSGRSSQCGQCQIRNQKTRKPQNHPSWKGGKDRIGGGRYDYCPECNSRKRKNAKYCKKCWAKHSLTVFKPGKLHILYGIRGLEHHAYKGNKSLDKCIRQSSEYKTWRAQIFSRDNFTCRDCGQHGGYLEVHHIKEFHFLLQEFLEKYPTFNKEKDKEKLRELSISYKPLWNTENAITLCKKCHNKTKRGKYAYKEV